MTAKLNEAETIMSDAVITGVGFYRMGNGSFVAINESAGAFWTNGLGNWWRPNGRYYPASNYSEPFNITARVCGFPGDGA